ncbi:MAG: hypothetical protein U0X73_05490 [Thermoanaerobaculia bacterium]
MPSETRGRPLKFGRPARVLALTLPEDVVEWLRQIHPDAAWAIVSLYEKQGRAAETRRTKQPKVQMAHLTPQRSLIVVDPETYRSLPGVAVIPMSAGRAFLALEDGKDIADLELAIIDQIEDPRTPAGERRELRTLLAEVRGWRRSRRYSFSTRSIIIVENRRAQRRSG